MSMGLRFIHRHDDSAICFESGCEQYAGPASGWRPEEAEAIRASAGVDLTRRHAALVRELLTERLGADMVTNELVAITTLAAQSEGERVQLTSEPGADAAHYAAEVGIPYAEAGTDRHGYHLVCPECGARCRPEPSAIESLSPGDRATYEDAVTKGASYAYSVHHEREHGKGGELR